MTKIRVLILEDRPSDAELMVGELRRHGFDVEWSRVETGEDLLAGLASSPDVILADYNLPQFNALEALRLTRERRSDVPVVVVTGTVGEEAAIECLQQGAVDYLLKDRLARLGDAVEKALEGRLARRERRLAESRLAEQSRLLESFFRNTQTCLVLLDRDFNFIRVNEAYAKACQRDPSEFPGLNHFELYPSEELKARFERTLRTKEICQIFGRPFTYRDQPERGVTHWDLNLAPILDETGEVDFLVFSLHDVSEQKKAEEELRASEEKYRHFFDEDLAGHFISRPDGRVLACNPAYARTFGFSSVQEALSQNMSSLYPSAEERAKFLDLVRRKKRVERCEKTLRRKDGRPVHVVESVLGSFDERGELVGLRGFLIDETERRVAELELRQAQKIEAVGRLAGGVAHDFNNLLTVILGYLDLLEPGLAAGDPRLVQLQEIRKAAERAAGLTRQLLAFSRRQVLEPTILDLNDVVKDVEKMLKRLIGEDIRIETRLAPGLGPVLADRGQIEQVIMNLALNARDAMPQGGTLVLKTADCSDRDRMDCDQGGSPAPCVMLSVADTGCGMNSTTMTHIFEPFFTTKEEGKGTGLGLATVFGIVKQSGGHIKVESKPSRGSTFRIFLPRAAKESQRAEAGPASSAPLPKGSETILVAEDEAALRTMTREMLTRAGYAVIEASGGEEALSLAGSHPGWIHLLLTDVVMPGMSGPELARKLSESRPGVAVVYMSGYMQVGVNQNGVLQPGIHLLQKPFTRSGLLLKIREVLAAAEHVAV